ncbi:MAG TPA: hypothetical protein ENF68_00945 [bacterium]|nr:MAG: hypothetical protein DRJ06_08390 [Candidatus Aminicenantes bacterium]HDH99233.1 hypothetical protein [bacterium]
MILASFFSALLGFFLSVYFLFKKGETGFLFAWTLCYLSLLLFIWLLSLPPGEELPEERGMRIFSFFLACIILGVIFLVIGWPLCHFYLK